MQSSSLLRAASRSLFVLKTAKGLLLLLLLLFSFFLPCDLFNFFFYSIQDDIADGAPHSEAEDHNEVPHKEGIV